MGIPTKNWLYFIGDNKGKTARISNGVVSMLAGPPVPLAQNPQGWQDIEVGFATDFKYNSLNRMATIPMNFIGDGAEILRYFMYEGKGFNEDLYVIALKKSYENGKYELQYSGKLDMSKAKDNPLIGVEVPAKEGGIMSYIAANESVIYEIDSTSANTDAESVLFDGASFKDIYQFGYGDPQGVTILTGTADYFSIPSVFFQQEGLSFNVVYSENVVHVNFDTLADLTANYTEAGYLMYFSDAAQSLKEIKIKGQIIMAPFLFNATIDLFYYTSRGRSLPLATGVALTDPATPIIIDTTIELYSDEQIYLIAKPYPGVLVADTFILYDIVLNYEIITKKTPTTALGFSPLAVWKALINKITEGQYTAESAYFTANKNIKLFSGESLRNIPTAKFKTSLDDFFNFYDSILPMGIRIDGNVVYMEPLTDLYGDGADILDFGELSKVEVNYAFNALANSAKFGHSTLTSDVIAGISDFNGINQFLLPITALKKELNKAGKYIASVYDIEVNRQPANTLSNDSQKADNNIFVANVSETTDADGNKLLYRKEYSEISGVVNAEDIYNIEQLTPARMLRANGPILRPIVEQQGNNAIQFISSNKNGHLITNEGGVIIDERANVPYTDLGPGLWHALDLNFVVPTPMAFASQLVAVNKGICKGRYMGNEIKFLPIGEMKSKPATEETQEMRMRLSTLTPLAVINSLSLAGTFSIDSMNNTIFISDLNSFHFSKVNNGLPASVTYKGIYDAPFEDRQNLNEYPRKYLQKWAKTEELVQLQFVTKGYDLLTVALVDYYGNLVSGHTCSIATNPGVLLPYVLQEVEIDISGLDNGIYRWVIMDGQNKLFRSEWFNLADEWYDTFLFEYSDTVNKYNTYFSPTFAPKIRVEANFLPLQPQSESTEYVDDIHDVEMLDGTTWDQLTLVLGGKSIIPGESQGIPDWMARKLNYILLLNQCIIENVKYSKAKAENIEPVLTSFMPLNVYTIDVVPANASTGLVYEGVPTPMTTSFVATMDASSFGIAGDEIIDIEVIND